MRVIHARNVHTALPQAVLLLKEYGVRRDSRNGPVLVAPWPVATVYEKPTERVVFHPERDANPFFHLVESVWMLLGKHDVATPAIFAKQIREYSDDGLTLHDAYGYRWRKHFHFDQLSVIIGRLTANPDDRRCVLQMWDTDTDLGHAGRAVPCNLTATFQISTSGALDMSVFNRSNDIIWGCYGANAVHFSFLQEYLAGRIGVPVGTYTQISVNWHAYVNVFEKMESLGQKAMTLFNRRDIVDPYATGRVVPVQLSPNAMHHVYESVSKEINLTGDVWGDMFITMCDAHRAWRHLPAPERYTESLSILSALPGNRSDWLVAGREWIQRRYDRWLAKQAGEFNTLREA